MWYSSTLNLLPGVELISGEFADWFSREREWFIFFLFHLATLAATDLTHVMLQSTCHFLFSFLYHIVRLDSQSGVIRDVSVERSSWTVSNVRDWGDPPPHTHTPPPLVDKSHSITPTLQHMKAGRLPLHQTRWAAGSADVQSPTVNRVKSAHPGLTTSDWLQTAGVATQLRTESAMKTWSKRWKYRWQLFSCLFFFFFLLQMFFKRQSGGFYEDLLKVYASTASILGSHPEIHC